MLQIRPVKLAETAMLRDFAERTFRIAYEAQNDPAQFDDYCRTAFSTDNFAAQLAAPGSEFWFGTWDDSLVAYLKLNFDHNPPELDGRRTVQVERIYVDPAWQGRRIGERLLDHAHQRAREAGAEWLWLGVWEKNPPALRFYQRCGYEICGTETFWLGDDPQVDWVLKKPVGPR